MRDLASRLRAIVQREGRLDPAVPRELTYTPAAVSAGEGAAAAVAEALEGAAIGASLVVLDRLVDGSRSHGRWRVAALAPDASLPLALADPRCAAVPDWATRPVFFDIETTGLSGGAGTLPFLIGCGWFEPEGFHLRQWLLTGPAGEPALLDALGRVLDEASLLVTFNGRAFDVPMMEMRWAFHRRANPAEDLPHLDVLAPARRLWGGRDDGDGSCSLSTLERAVLGVDRGPDVPGFEIPSRYFQFLRTGRAALIEGILDHNRHDVLSLAALTSHALRLVRDGPAACRDGFETLALGRLYERAGDRRRALEAYRRAVASIDREIHAESCARIALVLRRDGRYEEAAEAWRAVLSAVPHARDRARPLERMAHEALAIHHEHRAHDLDVAERHTRELAATGEGGRRADQVAHRLGRIQRKRAARGGAGEPKLPDV